MALSSLTFASFLGAILLSSAHPELLLEEDEKEFKNILLNFASGREVLSGESFQHQASSPQVPAHPTRHHAIYKHRRTPAHVDDDVQNDFGSGEVVENVTDISNENNTIYSNNEKRVPGNEKLSKNFASSTDEYLPLHYRLEKHLMRKYNRKLIPRWNYSQPITVLMSIALYQIIEVNEPQQFIQLNSWVVERWEDELLYWDPSDFGGLTEIILPHDSIWIPDTTLYNSLIMDDSGSRRLLDVKLTILPEKKRAQVEMLYPTLHMFSCMLDLRFFPYDVQKCKMTFGSWTHDMLELDFVPHNRSNSGAIGTEHCLENEGWNILSTEVKRREIKFRCCPNKYSLLDFSLNIQRKPLYYLVNLIIPTSIITLIAIVGFFSSPTVNNERAEKITLGITTLLSMSILIFMVSDQMPSTSSFIPLIGWFYTSMMMLISGATLASSFVIDIQKRGIIGLRPSSRTMRWARRLGKIILIEMPLLMKQAYILKAKQDKLIKQQQLLEALKLRYEQQQHLQKQQQQQQNNRRPTLWNILQRINRDDNNSATVSNNNGKMPNNNSFTNNAMTDSMSTTNSAGGGFNNPNVMLNSISLPPKTIKKISATSLSSLFSINRQNSPRNFNYPENELQNFSQFSPVSEEAAQLSSHAHSPTNSMPQKHSQLEKIFRRDSNDDSIDIEMKRKMSRRPKSSVDRTFMTVEGEKDVTMTPLDDGKITQSKPEPIIKDNLNLKTRPILKLITLPAKTLGTARKRQNSMKKRRLTSSSLTDTYGIDQGISMSTQLGCAALRASSRQSCSAGMPAATPGVDSPLGEGGDNSTPTTTGLASGTPGIDRSNGLGATAGLSASQRRNLAQIEYDWLAAVVERLFFIIFCILFFFMSFGINVLGIYYWYFNTEDQISQR